MKRLLQYFFFFFILTVISQQVVAQNVYVFSFTSLNGQSRSFNEFAGKKIMIAVIPSGHTSADSLLLDSLSAIANHYSDSITVIGIPSYDDGYYDDSLYSLRPYYDSMIPPPAVITQGMSTRKASVYQDPLFAWLTNAQENGHFNGDVTGVGQLYFIDTKGNLFGVCGPEQRPDYALMQKMIFSNTGN